MNKFPEHSQVRVKKLQEADRPFLCDKPVGRSPRVGDTGRVVHVYSNTDAYSVEKTDPSGQMIWLADFTHDELEPIS